MNITMVCGGNEGGIKNAPVSLTVSGSTERIQFDATDFTTFKAEKVVASNSTGGCVLKDADTNTVIQSFPSGTQNNVEIDITGHSLIDLYRSQSSATFTCVFTKITFE